MSKVLAIFCLFVLPLAAGAEIAERVAAIVNSEPILESDFKSLKQRAVKPDFLYPFLVENNFDLLKKGDRKASLDYLIGEKILESEIRRLNLSVTYEKVEQEIGNIAKRSRISTDELYREIRKEGFSKSQYQAFVKENMERQSLLEQEIISKIRVTDEDALGEYLRMHPEARVTVDEFTVAHILFDPKKGGSEAAYSRAQETLNRLNRGGNFESLAQQFSEDPNFSSGGLLGTFKGGEFLKEIEDAIGSLSAGQTTRIVRSRIGFHIVKLISKKVAPDPRFQREKDRIKARLIEQAIHRQFRVWLQAKKENAFIRINDAAL
ncbi:MAG TPA: peptidylprolyl isomerase [Pseudobdellovibrionaceae bacterium]|nr:peptidylprolyl isomerase [Pseudobdellovibrionaceae bacterium]